MGTGEEPLRRRFCRGAGCGVVFWICRHCDRGHRYCGERCRKKARRQQRRAANRRHQQSREGRLDHRDRQRAYRERRGLRRVTDHTSPATFDSGSITVAELSRSENGPESFCGEARYADCQRPAFHDIHSPRPRGTSAGLAAAHKRGVAIGRPRALTPEQILMAEAMTADPAISTRQVAEQFGIHRSTLYRHLNARQKGSA